MKTYASTPMKRVMRTKPIKASGAVVKGAVEKRVMHLTKKKIASIPRILPATTKMPVRIFTSEVLIGLTSALPLRMLTAEYPPQALHFRQTENLLDNLVVC